MNKNPKPESILTFQITHLIALIAFFFFLNLKISFNQGFLFDL